MHNPLTEISQLLDANIENKQAQVFTHVQTGYDETGLTATADGYLRLAKSLVDFVVAVRRGEATPQSIDGIQCPQSPDVGRLFHWLGEVPLDSTSLVQTEAEAEQITRWFQQNSPIDGI